ncbi:hypothetical protein QCD79_01180, partial [Pseudomonas quasicaspiana]|nr:hypothetical protein [Pseudomonas quasicaspiana]
PGKDAGLAAPGHGWPIAAAHGSGSAGGYTEHQRGAEWWGKSVLVTFALSKVTRCKSATNTSHYGDNGYVHRNECVNTNAMINRTVQERPRTVQLYRLSFANLHC